MSTPSSLPTPPAAQLASQQQKRAPTSIPNANRPATPSSVNPASTTAASKSTPTSHQRAASMGSKTVGTPGKTVGSLGGKTPKATGVSPAATGQSPLPSLAAGSAALTGVAGSSTDPSNILAAFDSPAALGTPGALAGGVGMSISLSNLGANLGLGSGLGLSTSASAAGQADEAEQRRKLEAVLEVLHQRPGRISKEGLERLAKRCGMDNLPEENSLAIAGQGTFSIDMEFQSKDDAPVSNVAFSYFNCSEALTAYADSAAKILKDDLTPSKDESRINASLSRFADNLERLARMDKLSIPGGNCFEAVFGIYTSLKRLYDHERKIAEVMHPENPAAGSQRMLAREVMCKKSGKPNMHARKRVGLSIDYWMDQHLVASKPSSPKSNGDQGTDKMDIDEKHSVEENQDDGNIYSLVIECEFSPPALYPTIRITEDWISERVEKPRDELEDALAEATGGSDDDMLDWLDPPLQLTSSAPTDSMNTDPMSNPGQPQARFIAKVEPPVVVPLQIAMQIYASVGIDISQETHHAMTFDGLVLPELQEPTTSIQQKELYVKRKIPSRNAETSMTDQDYGLGLFVSGVELARSITSIPFQHPRQLVALLPTLRQYAFIGSLLRRTFKKSTAASDNHDASSIDRDVKQSIVEDLDSFLADQTPPRTHSVDVAYASLPTPHATLNLATPREVRRVSYNILLNAELEVTEQDMVSMPEDGGQMDEVQKKVKALGKGLSVCEDVGVWAEWVQEKYL